MKNEKLTMMTFFPFTYKLSEPLAKYTALQAGGAAKKKKKKNILREAPIPA